MSTTTIGRARIAVLLLGAALVLLPSAAAQYAVTPERTVTLIAGDIYFEIEGQDRGAPLHVQAGEIVTFVIRNVGGMPHNVQFGRDLDPQSRRYTEELYPGFAGVDVDAGGSARVTLQMPVESGNWEVGCLVLGHYEAGQRLELVVE